MHYYHQQQKNSAGASQKLPPGTKLADLVEPRTFSSDEEDSSSSSSDSDEELAVETATKNEPSVDEEEDESGDDDDDDDDGSDSESDGDSACLDVLSPKLSSPIPLVEEEADLFFRPRKACQASAKMMSQVNELYAHEDVTDALIPDEFNPDTIPDFQPAHHRSSSSTKRKISELMNTSFDSKNSEEFEMKRAKLFRDACDGISSESDAESRATAASSSSSESAAALVAPVADI